MLAALLFVVVCSQRLILDFPDGNLGSDRELEILPLLDHVISFRAPNMISFTYSDAVPVFVDHHDAEQHAEREEKEAIDVVFDGVADGDAEREQDHLSDGEKRGSEHDISNRPTVFKRSEDEDKLGNDVNDGADQRPQDVDDPQGDGVRVAEYGILLEGGDSEEERDTK